MTDQQRGDLRPGQARDVRPARGLADQGRAPGGLLRRGQLRPRADPAGHRQRLQGLRRQDGDPGQLRHRAARPEEMLRIDPFTRRRSRTTGRSGMAEPAPGRAPTLVVTRTPLRVSLAGGGTDLAAFYERDHGAVLSTAIDKYIYVTVKRHSELFDEPIRLNYSKSEQVNRDRRDRQRHRPRVPALPGDRAADLHQHRRRPAGVDRPGRLEQPSPSGCSTRCTPARASASRPASWPRRPATSRSTCSGEPIGKQDQYAAAFGGLNCSCFRPGGAVTVEPQRVPDRQVAATLFDDMMLFWTGHQRDASSVLSEQKSATPTRG